MTDQYISIPGTVIAHGELTIPKAQAVVGAVTADRYTQLVACCRVTDEVELVIFDVEVELGQRLVNDIRRFERFAVRFECADVAAPEVLALRMDFPKVPHLNLRDFELPRSLCLFAEPYDELKLRWTAHMFVQRLREWLAQTAKGTLHGEDQPLEPLLPYSLSQLVIPIDIFSREDSAPLTLGEPIISPNGLKTYIAERYTPEHAAQGRVLHIALVLQRDFDRRTDCA